MKLRFSILLLAVVVLQAGCLKSRRVSDPAEYSRFISGHTTGIISRMDPVKISMADRVLKFSPGQELPGDILRFDPSVKGKALLYDANTILFKPESSWPSGKTIAATFDFSGLLDSETSLPPLNFEFSTIVPAFEVYPGALMASGTGPQQWFRAGGSMIASDVMEPDDLRELLTASSDQEKYPVKWEPGPGKNEFRFVVDSLPRLNNAYRLKLRWDGSPLDIDVEGEKTYLVPSRNEFVYLGSVRGTGGEQSLEITLSDPPDPAQDLNGLVYLAEGNPIRLVAEQNILHLYPLERMEGEKTLVIERFLRNESGISLQERVEEKSLFEPIPPVAEFIGQGVIMPGAGGLILPVRTASLRAFDVVVFKIFENNIPYFLQESNFSASDYFNLRQYGRPVYAKTIMVENLQPSDQSKWTNSYLDLSTLMNEDPGALYRIALLFRKEYSTYGCAAASTDDITPFIREGKISGEVLEQWDQPGWYSEYEWPDDYNWLERDNPCHSSYYIPERFKKKLVMSGRIGIIAKSADGLDFVVYTTDLVTGEPLKETKVSFFNYQNQPVGELTTGPEGGGEVTLQGKPFYIKASKGKDQAWLRVDDGSSLSLSNFDVSGAELQKGLKGMIYGERGVWRPGDTLFLTFILDDSENQLPAGYPVQFELTNSRAQIAYSHKNITGRDGFYSLKVPTGTDAPTGTWRAKFKAGGAIFEKNLKIETVKPNRLKIKLDFNQPVLGNFGPKPEGTLEINWLHGAVAPGIRTSIGLTFRKTKTTFSGFEKYTFDNPAGYFWWNETNVFDQEVDLAGKARFNPELPAGAGAPGMMEAVFLVRAFEKGGDFSTDVFTRPFSPFKKYVGLYVPDGGGYQQMLETGKDHLVKIACVDWQGKPLTARDLEVKVYRIDWRWWWSSGEEDLAYYVGNQNTEIVYQGKADALNGSGSFNLNVDAAKWGRYLILVHDPEGGHQAGLPVYFDWPSYVNRSGRANPAGATMLTFTADKDRYAVGDKAVLSFPAQPGSRALISIESGSKVLASQWKTCRNSEETFEFTVTGGMAPNVYVYLSLIQPHQQTVNDQPIRMYGVIPLMVDDPSTLLQPVIQMPDELKPDEKFTVKVRENQGKPMTFTIAVVDEGLLDLTRFKTPDPYGVFYAREALGVKTWDLFDLVLGAYGGRLERVLAIGGDDEASLAKNKKARRFEPVVRFAGPFSVQKNETREISFTMPNYVGSVRTMVIAGNDGAYGMAEKSTPVRKALMVLATLPRTLGPGEEVELPVSVFAMQDQVKEVTVKVETGDLVTAGQNQTLLRFAQTGEQMAYFRLRSGEQAGVARIRVTASSGNEHASQEIEIDIRNPNPTLTRSETFVLEPGQAKDLPWAFSGMKGTNSGQIYISGIPDFGLQQHLRYLVTYPYGCLEQTISSAFPQLYLPQLAKLSPQMQADVEKNIRAALSRLSGMALSDGSFSYWPGQNEPDSWATSYAGHFMLLAASGGYLLPAGLLDKWTEFQYRNAGNYRPDLVDNTAYQANNQAYRLYTLALARKPNMSAMNRMRESSRLTPTAAWILADAYIHAGKPEVARELIGGINYSETDRYEYSGMTYGSELRDMAFVLEVLTLLKKDDDALRLLEQMTTMLKDQVHNTQTTAFCLHAIAGFAGKNSGKGLDFSFDPGSGSPEQVKSDQSAYLFDLKENNRMSGMVRVENRKTDARLFVGISVYGQPLQGMETPVSEGIALEVLYKDDAGNPVNPDRLRQGTDFIAEVKVRHKGFFDYRNVALSQVFPSGWEIVNTRVQEVNSGLREDLYDYRDYRDDRVDTFFDLSMNQVKIFRVRLNAAYTGRYYLPAVNCGAMYERTIQANNQGRWVEVVR